MPASQWSVVSPQLAASSNTKPAARTAVFMRETATPCARRCSPQAASAITTGSRNAGQPNRKNSTSLTQAPATPMRFRIGVALPV